MYIISKELSSVPLKLTVLQKNDIEFDLDPFVFCLHNMQIKEQNDLVFYNSDCRGDYTTGQRAEFSLAQYSNKGQWYHQTFPMSKDGAVKIIESYTDEDYEEFISLQLSKLNKETTELLICVSDYGGQFPIKGVCSLNISLWRKDYMNEHMRSSYSEWEIASNNDVWKEYNCCLDSYDVNMDNAKAAILGVIKRDNNQFIFEQYFKPYKDIEELVNDYVEL